MPLADGTRLDHYEIVAPLGAGGMGEVYRAVDTKLRREVAIKILPPRFASDPGRLARFEREAHLLASLNHPNVAAIYGLEHIDGIRFLVLELVEGETLADRMKAGPVSVSEALNIAGQIAEALEAAHEKGVIHRDLKPGNVKITPEGKVKVLDFGLAKALTEPEPSVGASNPEAQSTVTLQETKAGVVMGTAAYMSPEQAEGKPTDKRSDIWSFGVVLYEMLTGKRCFDGKSTSHIMLKLLEQEPDYSKLPSAVPAEVRYLLERCLQKDPAERLKDVGDLRLQLAALAKQARTGGSKAPAPAASLPRKWVWVGVGAAVLAIAVVGFAFLRPKPAPPAQAMRFEIGQPGNATLSGVLTISPDGRKLAFAALTSGRNQLWVRSLETLEARPLDGTSGADGYPLWSPDSQTLVFSAQGKLKKIDASGGPAQTLADLPSTLLGGMWTPDNRIVVGEPNALLQVSEAGGTPAPLKLGPGQYRIPIFPSLLPDGRHFVFCQCEAPGEGIYLASLDGKQPPKRLLPDTSRVVYAPSPDPKLGYLLFVRGADVLVLGRGTLMAQAIDTGTLALVGEPIPVAEQVNAAGFSASTTGVLVYGDQRGTVSNAANAGMIQGQLTWFDRQGKVVSSIGDPGVYRKVAPSPDEKRVAIEKADERSSNVDVWIFEFARGTSTRLTFGGPFSAAPLWSPDGKRILYWSLRPSGPAWYQKAANGAGDEQLVFKPPKGEAPHSWSPDGRFILYHNTSRPADISAVDVSSSSPESRKTIPIAHSEFNEVFGRFSPDGKWFSYTSNETGATEVYVRPFTPDSPDSGGKWLVSKGGAHTGGAVWGRDGKEMFYIRPDGMMMSVDVSTNPVFSAEVPKELFKVPTDVVYFDVSADGKRFLMTAPAGSGATAPPYKVVLNWTSTLKK